MEHLNEINPQEELEQRNTVEQQNGSGSKKKRLLPGADIEVLVLAENVLPFWANSGLTLQWKALTAFQQEVNELKTILEERYAEGGMRQPITQQLVELDQEMDKRLKNVKNYILEAYEEEDLAKSYYAAFGIVRIGSNYKLPFDRDKRLVSLKMLIQELEAQGFADYKFGKAYWEGIYTKYQQLHQLAIQTDGGISEKVQRKNILLKTVKDTLQSLVYLIKANYPDRVNGVLREWGFQKERY